MEKDKLETINEKVEKMVWEKSTWEHMTPEEVEEYRSNLKKKLLEEEREVAKAESEFLEVEKKSQNSRLQTDLTRQQRLAVDIDMQRKESEFDEYEWNSIDRKYAKGALYRDARSVNPEWIMDSYKWDADRTIDKIEDMSEKRREDKNSAFRALQNKRMIGAQELSEVEKHIANEEERKAFDSFVNGSNGQVDLLDLMKQIPETMKGYLEAGNYHINATLDGINKKVDTFHHVSDTMFHDGNTYQQTISEAEENKRRVIETSAIEEATKNVRKPEIDTELSAIRTERTQEKDNSIEERE